MKYKIEYINDRPALEGDANSFIQFVKMNKTNLSCAYLSCADLYEADLRGAYLSRANLKDANLYHANLQGANLKDANLYHANLQGANLEGADIYHANLEGADLRGANLKGADMRDVNLNNASLNSANLTGAKIDFSAWPLWCGTQNVKVDKKIAAQIATHFCWLDCDDKEVKAAQEAVKPLARQCKHWQERKGEG